jgi:hypothetical protein
MFDIPLQNGQYAQVNPLDVYDPKRGSPAPEYTNAEATYRNEILRGLQLAYNVREQPQMELNDRPYSMYYLTNRQQDMAYNPPKLNNTDSRIVTGVTHEKDNTIEQIISDLNLKPQVCAYDEDDPMMIDFVELATAVLRRSLQKEGFYAKIGDFSRINISQGNVFIKMEEKVKHVVRKICINPDAPAYLHKWTTIIEEDGHICEAVAVPNTAVYLPNLLENDIHKQPRIWIVLHIPRTDAEKMFREFPRWQNVPTYPSNTVPPNTNGIWGDFYLQQPQKDYVELIWTESEVFNDANALVNGVLMYPVQEEQGKVIGYPLTNFSVSGEYTLIKGDNEKIPFYAYGRSVPSKNEVKEEVANEFLRIAVHKFRYSAFPSVGNNSDKVLPSEIWDPSTVVPDLMGSDLSILNPNGVLNPADFSFYQMIMASIDDTSVSKELDADAGNDQTATQYVDQKKQALKKLGITIDGTVDFLGEVFWSRLWSEIERLDKKKKIYDKTSKQFIDDYDHIMSSNPVAGQGNIQYHMKDDLSGIDPYEEFKKEKQSVKQQKHVYVSPKQAKEDFKKLKDKIYIKVVSEPDGQNQSLLGIMFNMLTQYANLQGKPIPNLNFEYLDKIIGQNSGFDQDKIFLPNKPQQNGVPQGAQGATPMNPRAPGGMAMGMMDQSSQQPTPGLPNLPGVSTPSKPPQNAILAGNP